MATTHPGVNDSLGETAPVAGLTVPPLLSESGSPGPIDEILPSVYDELRRLAAAYLRGERIEHTLQSTALVHEAYLRLRTQPDVEWQNPAHFIGIFARVMRQTLTNYAVARNRVKRGGPDKVQMTLEFYESRQVDVKAIDDALRELEVLDRRQAQIVELRFFGGLTIEEIAEVLAISPATVKRDWTVAKIWLHRELSTDA
jgi:RNA polymerase sigma factor (TIGR02999 family)